ncbi:hypothetical protein QYE76_024818 [Lolium multiflorum]|uniref:Uncharacterized protein n=1 Tax=Lolium multiflorum TaxID=4521 RepID=A0AAD8REM7_LOLMU|nr:hypothetical protein QYE76_024818 [Lolium multiflorum]
MRRKGSVGGSKRRRHHGADAAGPNRATYPPQGHGGPLWQLSGVTDASDVPLARSASLARFLERRKQKQRAAHAATPYSRREISPGSMDTFLMLSPGNTAVSGNPELSWFFGDEKGSRNEEALDTELKM